MRIAILLLLTSVARAATPATFALVLGVNDSGDPELPPLRFADDDAAQYNELFRSLGARTYLLSRFDENSRRLHPQAAAEAVEPRNDELAKVIESLRTDVARARSKGIPTVLYFIYAGHGTLKDGEGYLLLENGRMNGRRLQDEVIGRINADHTHVIVDACYSAFLAFSRGPGGERRPIGSGFAQLGAVLGSGRIGLLLSTSSARESHEWEAFSSGVFSHEVRSGLYGAADVDGDGQISYREIAAFVDRANASIPNDRYRPDLLARAPRDSEVLVDLRSTPGSRLRVDGSLHGHFTIESGDGVRLADFHNAAGQTLSLVYPSHVAGTVFVRRPDGLEYRLPRGSGTVDLVALTPTPSDVSNRGAAHEAFTRLFDLPFDRRIVSAFRFRAFPHSDQRYDLARRLRWSAIGVAATGGVLLVAGMATSLAARDLATSSANISQTEAAARNRQIHALNVAGGVLYGLAGVATIAAIATGVSSVRVGRRAWLSASLAPSLVVHGSF